MPAGSGFARAAADLSSALEHKTSLCEPFLGALPIDGAAISTLGTPFGSETVCASDQLAARLDEVQIDLGEGPCWLAVATRRPVLTPNLRNARDEAWPVFAKAIRNDHVGALHAFPLVVGSLSIGAIDMYTVKTGSFSDQQVSDASQLAGIAARQVLRRALSTRQAREGETQAGEDVSEYSRRVVHQATGMVLVQLDVSAADALLVIRGHAFAHGIPVRDVATAIVERRLDLAQGPAGVEN